MPSIAVDPTAPLEVTVDLQSKQHAGFRLFTRGAAPGAPERFLKRDTKDASAIIAEPEQGGALVYEFLYFATAEPFRAVIAFRQRGRLLDDAITVTGDPDARYVQGEVRFT